MAMKAKAAPPSAQPRKKAKGAVSSSVGSSDQDEMFELRIELEGSDPVVWRRLVIPSRFSVQQLHSAVQSAMGWSNSHAHQFVGEGFKVKMAGDLVFNFEAKETILTEDKTTIAKMFQMHRHTHVVYEYDFGDGWGHSIELCRTFTAGPGQSKTRCTAGELAGPPDDCGGIYGFADFKTALADPSHPEHDDLKEWYENSASNGGREWDPNRVDLAEINALIDDPPY